MNKKKKQSWQHPDTIITSLSMRLPALTLSEDALLFQAGQLQSQAVCKILQYLNPDNNYKLSDKQLEEQVRTEFNVSRRWAQSWIKEAQAKRIGVVELSQTRLIGASDRIKRLEKKVKKVEQQVRDYSQTPKKKPVNKNGETRKPPSLKILKRNARNLRSRLDRETAKIEDLKKLVNKEVEPSICYGGKQLARKRHRCQTMTEIAQWQTEWEQARYGHLFIEGARDRNCGNPYLQYNRVNNQLKITLPTRDPITGKNVSFTTVPTSSDDRLDQLLGYDGPVTTRLSYNRKKGYWYIHFTIREQVTPEWTSQKNGAIGIDLNPDHIAYSYVTAQGNPVITDTGRIDIVMGSQQQATFKRASQVAKELVAMAVDKGCPLVLEDLNFGAAKLNLRYLPKKLRVLFSSFAYNAYKTIIQREAARSGVEVLLVRPAYTSKLGQTNYASPLGISVDMAAAVVIARRGLEFRERVRPGVLDRFALEDATSVKLISRYLPPRRRTWDDTRLRRTSLSAASIVPLSSSLDNTSDKIIVNGTSPREPASVPHTDT